MNSAEDVSRYNDNNSHYCSPVLARKNINSYNFPEKSPKKDKKWSFGSLFRRKKKESESSSDEENQNKSFLQKKKKKSDKRKRVNNTLGFDHVVIPPRQTNGYKEAPAEPLVPKNNFITASDFTSRFIPLKDSSDNLNRSNNSLGSPSVCSLGRRKKETVKARAEARRDTSKGEDSSDDDSQISAFRSDDSLSKSRDGSVSRRSRTARTQRYLRRRSRDEEVRDYIKPALDSKNLQIEKNKNPLPKPRISYTNSAPSSKTHFSGLTTIPPSHNSYNKYRTMGTSNDLPDKYLYQYNDRGNKYSLPNVNSHRSVSYDSNMNNSTSPEVNGVLHVEFPLYQTLNKNSFKKHPPPPPPRDPRRLIAVQNGDPRPMSYSFENGYRKTSEYKPDTNQNFLNHNFRSTSDDHISSEPLQRVPLIQRPSSTTPEMNRLQKLSKNTTEGEEKPYRYLTDKNPRSRKPICIQAENEQPTWSQKTFNFWRQKDEEQRHNRKSTSASPLIFTAQTHVTTNIFLPPAKTEEPVSSNSNSLKRQSSPFRPIMSPKASSPEDETPKRKSTNLEEALDELEAIYNSLHLGDEDLLDRAEKREADAVQKQKLFSDTTLGFDPNFDSTRKKRISKKSEPNIKTDDMAFRKLNRERYNTVNDPQSTVASISYLLTSPVFSTEELPPPKIKSDEPDVTFDDVVFRNVMHTNNTLKVNDPQPPFGIPVGPVSPAANSDYLHAMPEPTEKQRGVPDIVKDDLAYRNLRKDAHKGNSLPQALVNEDLFNCDGFKKKRAVRSLSANISNLMHKNDVKLNPFDDYCAPQNLTDVADALEIARQILRDKEDKINATRQAFMSDGELKYRRYDSTSPTEQRMRFLNEMKAISPSQVQTTEDRLDCKPPTPDRRSRMSKESTPTASSSSEDAELKKQLRQSTLDELLTSLAVETREGSDKITEELNYIDQLQPIPVEDESNEDHIKLCEKLLQCVVVNNAANTEELDVCEEVAKIKIDPIPEIVANIVSLPSDKSDVNPVATEVYSESDHDYVNIQSNDEAEQDVVKKDDLIAAFEAVDETLRNMNSKKDDCQVEEGDRAKDCCGISNKRFPRDPRTQKKNQYLSELRRPCDVSHPHKAKMSESKNTRAERMAQYKEERRKQLASQFAPLTEPQSLSSSSSSRRRIISHKEISSSSEEPRTTRASRLRAAATAQETSSSSITKHEKEKISLLSNENDAQRSNKLDRDKSNKRKSNLNRALNTEEVPQPDTSDDFVNRRRRRRFFPPEVLQQAAKVSALHNENKSDKNLTATSTTRSPVKKSELRIHMDNARKGHLISSFTNIGKSTRVSPKKDEKISPIKQENGSPSSVKHRSSNVSKRMDELSALTRDALARVEQLAIKTRDTTKNKISTTKPKIESESTKIQKHSILKKKEESVPISILKRKVSLDEFRVGSPPTSTPPVTFSPNVVDPSTNRKRQGILKKRRSLDESQVLRHRSCSPEVAANRSDSRSILKNQRRSSLEEILRTRSPESGLHSILKRRSSRHEDDVDPPINSPEPHGILKRRSGSSSTGSNNTHSPHVSIATAVILAAAGGAEMVLESNELVRPILKKKSISEEVSFDSTEVPKPILKKKSSTDTDDCEDKPKRPILKNSRNSVEERDSDVSESSHHSSYRYSYQNDSECEVRPILKQGTSRENSPRPRLSFCSGSGEAERQSRNSKRSHTICSDFNVKNSIGHNAETEDRELSKPRPLSVCDMVLNIEKRLSTGAIPKTTKRQSGRYRTQPVTYDELEASRNCVQNQDILAPTFPLSTSVLSTSEFNGNAHSLLDLTCSFEGDNNINSFLSSSLPNNTFDSGISGKMSSDSAFQSLGDGLELENESSSSNPSPLQSLPEKFSPAKLQMKALAEEAKKMQLKRSGGVNTFKLKNRDEPSSSRFSTQPVTLGEVREAARLDKDDSSDCRTDRSDPACLSISDRIKLFNQFAPTHNRIPRSARFQTQPVTVEELETARAPPYRKHNMFALDNSSENQRGERKGILKSKLDFSQIKKRVSQDSLRSVLKKPYGSPPGGLRSILKPESAEFAQDEGISSDDSQSGSEVESVLKNNNNNKIVDSADELKNGKSSSDDVTLTSDGDSSGGREVRSIIGGGEWSARKRHRDRVSNENFLYKSKSQGVVHDEEEIKTSGVRRSLTQSAMPQKIAELQAKLQQSGDSDWRKRLPKLNSANEEISLLNVKNIYNDELSEKSTILSARKDELDAAAKQWRSRVEQSDAINFSVAGRMKQKNDLPTIPINLPALNKTTKTPTAKTFKGKEGGDTASLPTSPEKNDSVGVKRSISLPGAGDTDTGSQETAVKSRKVKVERPDNITFTSFFKDLESTKTSDAPEISVDDFDVISRQSDSLLVQKRTVRVQKRREASKNPIKALASRSDIFDEYTEIITGVAEKEQHRLKVEKLAKSSNFAVEALAGLASKEDFSSIALKRSSSWNSAYPPYKDLMLLQIKGRRFVQTRLVEPTAASINEGDCYILVTPNAIYNFIGAYSNVIEQSRAAELTKIIHEKSDLGCKCDKIITINSKKIGGCATSDLDKFWKILGATKDIEVTPAGHPDEDEIYESSILGTNMIYEYNNEELAPFDEFWGTAPKISMLNSAKTFVFDFGSEMYVWSGKNALLEQKKKALKLAKELWNEGYNYTECGVSPLGITMMLGLRKEKHENLKDKVRPKWSLFAKVTQHGETILFKEKFVDWPDYSRVIRVKEDGSDKNVETKFDFKPCDVEEMYNSKCGEPDLIADGLHLGRGISYYDEDSHRTFNFKTRSVTCWVILEYSYEQLSDKSAGQFYDGSSYIVRWEYCANTSGRELSGKPSKYMQSGRDLCLYFCWQGSNATVNEKGAAALLTIQLDSENARQIRVLQGAEPPVFLNLFKGDMVVHSGKFEKSSEETDHRLYISRGENESESFLTEVPCSMRSLRSRASFILVGCKTGEVTVWNGCKASNWTKKVTQEIADRITESQLSEFGFSENCEEFSMDVVEEGHESKDFLNVLGGEKRQLYASLAKVNETFDFTPRMFHLSSLSGKFEAKEICCPHRSEHITPYPWLQCDLYSASQPALFLLDNHHEVWLWQGWWPELENDSVLGDQTGTGAVRWQEERKVAMQTAVAYCKRESSRQIPAYLVWGGLEPLAFTNLFPFWRDRDDISELNMHDGKKPGEVVEVEKELDLLTRSTYPLEQLLQRPLPYGVDPTRIENYLSPEDFSELMSMTIEEFQKLPTWKQTSVKKEKGLF